MYWIAKFADKIAGTRAMLLGCWFIVSYKILQQAEALSSEMLLAYVGSFAAPYIGGKFADAKASAPAATVVPSQLDVNLTTREGQNV